MVLANVVSIQHSIIIPEAVSLRIKPQRGRYAACYASKCDDSHTSQRRAFLLGCGSVCVNAIPSLNKRAEAEEVNQAVQRCFLEVSVDGVVLGRVVIALSDPESLGARRFSDLCKGIQGVGYRRSKFDAIFEGKYVRNAGVQALSYGETQSPIAGGESVAELVRELQASRQSHTTAGLVSLQVQPTQDMYASSLCRPPPNSPATQVVLGLGEARVYLPCRVETTKLVAEKGKLVEVVERSGIIPNGTSFTITTGPAPGLDRTHLIIGRVVEGSDVLAQVDKLPVVKNNSGSPFFMVGKAVGDKRANVAGAVFGTDIGAFFSSFSQVFALCRVGI